jgi:hypothetical protein
MEARIERDSYGLRARPAIGDGRTVWVESPWLNQGKTAND